MSEPTDTFIPDGDILKMLLSMGIAESDAKTALFRTGNKSANDAVDYIFRNEVQDSNINTRNISGDPASNQPAAETGDDGEWEDMDDGDYYKMTFVVNTSLKMGIGKIAAQVGHACLGLYRQMLEKDGGVEGSQWEIDGEKKIVLKGNTTEHLKELHSKAKEAKVVSYLVHDAGHTQIPAGSVTVLGLFGLEKDVDKISGKLTLL